MQFEKLYQCLIENGMSDWQQELARQLDDYFTNVKHGDYERWHKAIKQLPQIKTDYIHFDQAAVTIGKASEISDSQRDILIKSLKEMMPWRKGPFNLFGIDIDTEWRSNLKWDRVKPYIKPLTDKLVLDIGSGNGYYGWRMLEEDVKYIVGIDPTLLFYMQFQLMKHYRPQSTIDVLPFGIQALPEAGFKFDTVLSMGVIYHRKDPLQHLEQLKSCLCTGGELVLETLVLDTDKENILNPEGRYAKMNNVHAIPSLTSLTTWAQDAGFINVQIVDVSSTTTHEQRRTEWMQFESLSDFLDKEDNTKTIEGYPAPMRAVLIAEKP